MHSEDTIPDGLCQCGCGERTTLARSTWARYGWVKGQPLRYLHGHNVVGPLRYTVDPDTGCWLWGGARSGLGYGIIRRGKTQFAHRWMYVQHRGPIPEGLALDHLCHTPPCVNPDHLEPVTNAENLRRGNSTKLTVADVHAIRALRGKLPALDIALRFGVTPGQINNIFYGKSWVGV